MCAMFVEGEAWLYGMLYLSLVVLEKMNEKLSLGLGDGGFKCSCWVDLGSQAQAG